MILPYHLIRGFCSLRQALHLLAQPLLCFFHKPPIPRSPPRPEECPRSPNQSRVEVREPSAQSGIRGLFEINTQMRSSLLSVIEIVDQQPLLPDLETALEDALRIFAPKGKAAMARELIEGWWWPRVCKALMTSPPGTIPITSLETKFDDIRDMLKRDSLVADFEHVDPSESEVAGFDGFRFVKQLHVIGLGGNRIGYAKRDYYRAFAQRSKWTREHVVLDDELEKFETTLIEEWEPRFGAMCDAHQAVEPDEPTLQQAGQQIYQWVRPRPVFHFDHYRLVF